jgi:hypothetical protein
VELVKSDKKTKLDTSEWEINYHEFKIFGINRELAQFILVLDEAVSDNLKNALLRFAMEVERTYMPDLVHFKGEVSKFADIDSIVPKFFAKDWLLPNFVKELSTDELNRLPYLERQIYNLGSFYAKERGYFYIQHLLTNALQMLKGDQNHIIDAIHNLMQKKYFTTSRVSMLIE